MHKYTMSLIVVGPFRESIVVGHATSLARFVSSPMGLRAVDLVPPLKGILSIINFRSRYDLA